jgi:predicted RNA-binding Zn-ribbon protein involved in translation (DUF1610 family)
MATASHQRTAGKMICPRCGAQMNHHGDKPVLGDDAASPSELDPFAGGRIVEFHSCPNCGANASRDA